MYIRTLKLTILLLHVRYSTYYILVLITSRVALQTLFRGKKNKNHFFGAKWTLFRVLEAFSGKTQKWRLSRGNRYFLGAYFTFWYFLGAKEAFSGLIVLFGNFLGAKEAFSGLIVLFGNFLGAVDPFSGLRRLSRGNGHFLGGVRRFYHFSGVNISPVLGST